MKERKERKGWGVGGRRMSYEREKKEKGGGGY